jgi:hypothetical protein
VTVVHDRGEEPRGRIIIACGMISSANDSSFRTATSTVTIGYVRSTSIPAICCQAPKAPASSIRRRTFPT